MRLYSRPDGVYSHRARLVLAEKGVAAGIVDATEAVRDLADLNPYGEAPTLVDRDLVLYDSRVIADYLDERFPHPPLMPVDPVDRAKARLVLSRIERDWYRLLDQLDEGAARDGETVRRHLGESLAASDEVFGSGTRFFLSDELTMMDCLLAPMLWRLPHYGVELPESARNVHAYAQRFFERPAFQNSLSDVERAMRAV
jgi:RNA polymerase-associated protein